MHLYSARLPADDVVTVNGVRVTSVSRTMVDLARTLSYRDAVAVVDAGLRAGVPHSAITAQLDVARRWRGNAGARLAVAFGDMRAESSGESWSRVLMAQVGVPLPQLQKEFIGAQEQVDMRVDFDWEDFGVAGEFDGAVKYGRLLRPGQSVDQVIRAERARESRLRSDHDRWVIRWTNADLKDPEHFRTLITTGLRQGLRRTR